jgi:protein TonB
MRQKYLTGILLAIAAHAGIIFLGGLFFLKSKSDHGTLQQVALLSEQEIAAEKDKARDKDSEKQDKPEEQSEEIESEEEKAPDAEELIRSLDQPSNAMPELEAASLSAIEAALSGSAGASGDFSEALTFSSGGRIGGTGKAGVLDDKFEKVFSLDEIDQKPRVVFQASPVYPAGLKRVECVVGLIFVVDETGKVANARVEKPSNTAFEKSALTAVRQWKFEPAVKGGQRVSCTMRVPIRFQAA